MEGWEKRKKAGVVEDVEIGGKGIDWRNRGIGEIEGWEERWRSSRQMGGRGGRVGDGGMGGRGG